MVDQHHPREGYQEAQTHVQDTTQQGKSSGLARAVGFAVAFLLAIPLGQAAFRAVDYFFFLYVLLAWGIYAIGRNRLPSRAKPFAAGLAVMAGMMLGRLGLILFSQQGWMLGYWAFDVALLSPGIIWLLRNPGAAPVVYCGGYAALTIALSFPALTLGSGPAFPAAVTGAILWVAAVLLLVRGLRGGSTVAKAPTVDPGP